MNRALWQKAVFDAWRQLAVSSVLLLVFAWLFVWLMSRFQIGAWSTLLNLLPNFFQPMLGVPLAKLATPTGQISILYLHGITMLICVGWAVARGSDPISGEIGRGTLDLILSLPIRRFSVVLAPAVVDTAGAAVLVASVWLGSAIGLSVVEFGNVSLRSFLPGAVNLFCMVFCLTAITTLVSAFSCDRWRTIFIAAGFFVVSLMLDMTGRLWPAGEWLRYGSFLAAFEPQQLILMPDPTGTTALKCNATLLGLGLLCYVSAAVVLSRRDIPVAR